MNNVANGGGCDARTEYGHQYNLMVAAKKLGCVQCLTTVMGMSSKANDVGVNPDRTVPGLGTATITVEPQDDACVLQLKVVSTIADFFEILDFRIGNKSQFPTDNPIPAMMFSEVSTEMVLSFACLKPGIKVQVEVRNNDANDQLFLAGAVVATAWPPS